MTVFNLFPLFQHEQTETAGVVCRVGAGADRPLSSLQGLRRARSANHRPATVIGVYVKMTFNLFKCISFFASVER